MSCQVVVFLHLVLALYRRKATADMEFLALTINNNYGGTQVWINLEHVVRMTRKKTMSGKSSYSIEVVGGDTHEYDDAAVVETIDNYLRDRDMSQ